MLKVISYLFLLFILPTIFSCSTGKNSPDEKPPSIYSAPVSVLLNTKDGYKKNAVTGDSIRPIVNRFNDTIKTGVPLLIAGRKYSSDSYVNTIITKAETPKTQLLYSNKQTLSEKPAMIQIDESKLTKFIPRKDDSSHIFISSHGQTFKTGVPFFVNGRKVNCIQPRSYKSLPMTLDENTVHDIQHLNTDQGLISSFVNSISEDRSGKIWFGTTRGAVKFDGSNLTTYTTKEGLCYDDVRAVLEDSNGTIWFGTGGGAICNYNGEFFTHFTEKDGLPTDVIWSIAEDKAGNIWFATRDGALKYDGKFFTIYSVKEGLPANNCLSVKVDETGNIWINTVAGIVKYDGKDFFRYEELDAFTVNNIFNSVKDAKGNLWFSNSNNDIFKYDGNILERYEIAEDKFSRVSSIAADKSGNIWVGTRGAGVVKLNPGSFIRYRSGDGLSGNFIGTILEDKNGNIWIGSGTILSKFDGKKISNYSIKEGLYNGEVQKLYQDKAGNIWIGGINVITKFNEKNFINYSLVKGYPPFMIWSITEDRSGNIWFTTYGKGIFKLDARMNDTIGQGKFFTNYSTQDGLSDSVLTTMLEDRSGNLWFGSEKGLIRYDGKSFTHYTEREGLPSNTINSVFEDKDGMLWIATNTGLTSFDGKIFTCYTEEQGLSSNLVFSITEDRKGNIWAGTVKGLNLLEKNGNTSNTGRLVKSFTKEDGLISAGFNIGSVVIDSKDRIWWGTEKNLTMLDLKQFNVSEKIPDIFLNELYINENFIDYRNLPDSSKKGMKYDNKTVSGNLPQDLKLSINLNHLTFHYSAIDWSGPHQLKFQYIIEGLDKKWGPVTSSTQADYRNIPYGDYIFKVRATGANQQWSKPIKYAFTINPPWWHTWWFRTLAAVFILLSLYGIYMYRTTALRERQKFLVKTVDQRTEQLRESLNEKEVLLKEIHHRVKNNLEVISSLLMLQKNNITDEKAKAALAEGQSRVQSIALIHHKLYRTDDLASVEMKGFAKDLFKQVADVYNKPGGKIRFDTSETEMTVDTDSAVPLGLILNELFTNAFKYAVAPEKENIFSLQLTELLIADETHYKLVFRDNGKGMPADFNIEQTTSLGMKVIQLLTKQLGGSLKHYNDNGAVFEIGFSNRNLTGKTI
jgi:two-component sensor histidine kinase/ligand-binding sensor domain-containing protein